MSNSQNTGRRYIPKFFTYGGSTEWRPNIAYSAKTIVTKNFKVYTSIVNVPSNIGSPEDNPKYWQPAVITDEVMQTIIDELGKLDGDVSEFEHRVEVLENEVGELEIAIRDVQEDVDKLKNNLITDSASGAIASFPDGGDGFAVRDLKVQLEPIQAGSGDPSPDNVRPISGRDSVTVTRTGVNVWDEEWEVGSINATTGEDEQNNSIIRCVGYIKAFPNTTYYVSNPEAVVIFFYDAEKNYIDSTTKQNQTFTTPSNTSFIRFRVSYAHGATYNHDISINYPSTDHDYHAGHVQTVEISLGQTVYGGTLDVTQGVLTVDRACVDMGDLNWVYYSTNPNTARFSASVDNTKSFANDAVANILCSIYKPDTYNQVSGHWVDKAIAIARDAAFYVYDSAYTDAATFKTSVTGQTLAYELAEPITVQLTAKQMTTLLGQNNVWSDADSVAVDYVADTKLYIAKVIADALS